MVAVGVYVCVCVRVPVCVCVCYELQCRGTPGDTNPPLLQSLSLQTNKYDYESKENYFPGEEKKKPYSNTLWKTKKNTERHQHYKIKT